MMAPARTVTAQKGQLPRRRASGKTDPKKLQPIEQDAIQDILDRGMASPVNLVKDGFLNPDAFIDARGSDDFPYPAESERILTAMREWFHRKSGRAGSITWEFGFALMADYGTHENQSNKVNQVAQMVSRGWRPVNRDIVGNQFNDYIRMAIGLEWIDEGLLAWAGRGGFVEWHVLMITPKYRKEERREIRSQQFLKSVAPVEDPEDVALAEPYVQERKHQTRKVGKEGAPELASGRGDLDAEVEDFAKGFEDGVAE